LIEVTLASMAGALVLVAIYSVFSQAIRMRDQANERTHQAVLRQRAESILRNDLKGAYISGGALAQSLVATTQNPYAAHFPGYLKFTTTTSRDTDDDLRGDVQEVSYYIDDDPDATTRDAGILKRSIDRNLLAQTRELTKSQDLLSGVTSIETWFFDGSQWTQNWTYNAGDTTLPVAVRVTIHQIATSSKLSNPVPLEITVPWNIQPFSTGTSSASTTGTSSASATTSSTSSTVSVIPPQQDGEIPGRPGVNVGDEDNSTGGTTQ
jgi:type II secretory pathway component PulJ